MPGLLALLAHPDDEIFCAGLLVALSRQDVPVHVVYWTRGEGGMSRKRRAFWKCIPRALHPRVGEARRAAAVLGAASLTFLDAVDPAPDPELRAPGQRTTVFMKKLARHVKFLQPEMLLTHGSNGDYGHPAHLRLHQLAQQFIEKKPDYPLLSFNATWPAAPAARFLNADDPADFVFDSHPYSSKKIDIMRAHSSQKLAFAAMAPGGDVRELLRLGRYEGYHCWSTGEQRDSTLKKLKRWTGDV